MDKQTIYFLFILIVAILAGVAVYNTTYPKSFATYIMQDRSSAKDHLGRPDHTLGWPYNDNSWSRGYTEG